MPKHSSNSQRNPERIRGRRQQHKAKGNGTQPMPVVEYHDTPVSARVSWGWMNQRRRQLWAASRPEFNAKVRTMADMTADELEAIRKRHEKC